METEGPTITELEGDKDSESTQEDYEIEMSEKQVRGLFFIVY